MIRAKMKLLKKLKNARAKSKVKKAKKASK